MSVTKSTFGRVKVGWVDRALALHADSDGEYGGPGRETSAASGATFMPWGRFHFGTAPLTERQFVSAPQVNCPCAVGCLLDADAGAMTVFVNGEPLARQCAYTFPTDREWYPSVGLGWDNDALFSSAV